MPRRHRDSSWRSENIAPYQRWHHFHADPSDDLVLRSSDHMLFRVSSWKIARSCTLLGEALSLAPQGSGKVFDVNAHSRLLEMLLDSINSHAPIKHTGEEDEVCLNFDLLDLARLYGCDSAKRRAMANLCGPIRLGDHHWDVLVEASVRDDAELGRMFWRGVTKMDLMASNSWNWVDKLRPAWRQDIMVGLFGRDHLPLRRMRELAEVELFLREECLDWVNGFRR